MSHESKLAHQDHLNRFFEQHPAPSLQKRAMKAMRLLESAYSPLPGKPEGWSAGIIYAVANRDRRACSVPGLLNSEVEAICDVSLGTIRRRAAQIARMLEW